MGDAATDYSVVTHDSTKFSSSQVFADKFKEQFDSMVPKAEYFMYEAMGDDKKPQGQALVKLVRLADDFTARGGAWLRCAHLAASDSYYGYWAEKHLLDSGEVIYHLCAVPASQCKSKWGDSPGQRQIHFNKWTLCPPVGMLFLPWARETGLHLMREKLNSQNRNHEEQLNAQRRSQAKKEQLGDAERLRLRSAAGEPVLRERGAEAPLFPGGLRLRDGPGARPGHVEGEGLPVRQMPGGLAGVLDDFEKVRAPAALMLASSFVDVPRIEAEDFSTGFPRLCSLRRQPILARSAGEETRLRSRRMPQRVEVKDAGVPKRALGHKTSRRSRAISSREEVLGREEGRCVTKRPSRSFGHSKGRGSIFT
ncbi:unnamed protein product [Polarella glacialis]|uniref:Uncharacterized protein n=1 Tax=Polarella glacialis TaxID=89957 RepID=A0A813D6B9_POLGL|nr:unnamed protein product [Polarella glacialis]